MKRSPRLKKTDLITKEEILKQKLHKDTLTPNDIKNILYLDKDGFDAWMLRMCELYPEINANIFKEGKYFKFKPDWQSLFLVLFGAITDHPEYNRDTIKQNVTMDGISKYYKKLKTHMEEYMTEEEQLDIKASPSYIRSELETLIVDEINGKIAKISAMIQMMPDDLRFRVLAGVNDDMETWQLELAGMQANHLVKTSLDERGLDDKTKHEMREYRQSFDDMLIERLKWIIKSQEEWQEGEKELNEMISSNEDEKAAVNARFKELIINPWLATANNNIRNFIEETRQTIFKEPSNDMIIKKVLQSLEGIEEARVQAIRATMEQALIALQVSDEKSSKNRAQARKALDEILHNSVLQKFTK